MGTATAGTAPTASSTTASKRYCDESWLKGGWGGACLDILLDISSRGLTAGGSVLGTCVLSS